MKTVLLFGAGGQLGKLVSQYTPDTVNLHSFTHNDLDITDARSVKDVISEHIPDIIINTAAYTAVDNAESESVSAYKINAEAVENIAKTAAIKTKIIHISTDFVFHNANSSPYLPEDEVSPVSIYGKSKHAGEQALLTFHPHNSIVLRTSWLYSAHGKNFVTTMLNLMRTRDQINIINDQFGSPTSALHLAKVIWKFAGLESSEGIFHWSDRGVITWYDFALTIHSIARNLGILDKDVQITPIPTSEYPTAAIRPLYSALDSSSTESLLGLETIPWQVQLLDVLTEIQNKSEIL